MVSFKQRSLQLKTAAVVAAAVLIVLVVALTLFGAVLSEALLTFADLLGIAGITNPAVIAGVFALLVMVAFLAAAYYGYRRFVHL